MASRLKLRVVPARRLEVSIPADPVLQQPYSTLTRGHYEEVEETYKQQHDKLMSRLDMIDRYLGNTSIYGITDTPKMREREQVFNEIHNLEIEFCKLAEPEPSINDWGHLIDIDYERYKDWYLREKIKAEKLVRYLPESKHRLAILEDREERFMNLYNSQHESSI